MPSVMNAPIFIEDEELKTPVQTGSPEAMKEQQPPVRNLFESKGFTDAPEPLIEEAV